MNLKIHRSIILNDLAFLPSTNHRLLIYLVIHPPSICLITLETTYKPISINEFDLTHPMELIISEITLILLPVFERWFLNVVQIDIIFLEIIRNISIGLYVSSITVVVKYSFTIVFVVGPLTFIDHLVINIG